MENKKIDLTRMQKLLEGLKIEEINSTSNSSITSLETLSSYNRSFTINLYDVFQILSHEGTILGLSDIGYPHELKTKILNHYKDTLKDSKAILVIYSLHPDTTISYVEEIMQEIYNILGDNKADFIFDVQIDFTLSVDQIGFKLLYIVDTIEPDFHKKLAILKANEIETKLYKQLYDENHILRNQLTRSKAENDKLKQQIRRLENSLMVLSPKIT